MLRTVPDPVLDRILARVSRSFYLSLAVLPRSVRTQLSVAYLVARAADTIADTRAVKSERRRELLGELREALLDEEKARRLVARLPRERVGGQGDEGGDDDGRGGGERDGEALLLSRLGDCLALLLREDAADKARTGRVLDALCTGMERDLARFPDEKALRALATMEELDEHTYFAAGCVGEFWTAMAAAHVPSVAHMAEPELVERSVRLGKALQLVNVIRDAPADLAQGRCYLPASLLSRQGLSPEDLLGPRRHLARPILDELRALALEHLDTAWPYVLAIPAREPRLRLACLWPLWIGLDTLALVGQSADPLAPGSVIKVTRKQVYGMIAESLAVVSVGPLLTRQHWKRRLRAACGLPGGPPLPRALDDGALGDRMPPAPPAGSAVS